MQKLIAECQELKTLDSADFPGGTLEGYASVFNNVDDGGDIVIPGAFSKTLKENLPAKRVKLIDSHGMHRGTEATIGLVTAAMEDGHGLKFSAFFSVTEEAQKIRTKVKEGILDALSFGYDTIQATTDSLTGMRLLKELKLWEISVVTWGMNPKAAITNLKSATDCALALAPNIENWDAASALERVQKWAQGKSNTWTEFAWNRYGAAFCEAKSRDLAEGFHFQVADVINDQLCLVPELIKGALENAKQKNVAPELLAKLQELGKKAGLNLEPEQASGEAFQHLLAKMSMQSLKTKILLG